MNGILSGKRGLIIGIANANSIAYGCAKVMREQGAELAITYLNEKAEPFVRPLAESLQAAVCLPMDVTQEDQIEAVFAQLTTAWGSIDFLIHAIAFAPKADLQGRVVDCSRAGFLKACDVSCYSLIRLSHYALPLMTDGGAIITTSYYGGEKVVANYSIMGPIKAALEGTVIYLAAELGERQIRVNAISPGPIATRAASGIENFEQILHQAERRSPQKTLVSIEDVGQLATFLASDYAKHITGNIAYVDAGMHIMGLVENCKFC